MGMILCHGRMDGVDDRRDLAKETMYAKWSMCRPAAPMM